MTLGTAGLATEKVVYKSVTIADGTTTAEIDLKGGTLVGLFTPASIASSSVTITVAPETGGTFVTAKDPVGSIAPAGAAYTLTIAQSGYYAIPPSVTAGMRFIKLVMSDTETAKTFTLAYRSID